MKTPNSSCQLLGIVFVFAMLIISNGESISPKIKAVNLGGWLVAEGWIKPSLFASIPNSDLLDGVQLRFKSFTTGNFLSAEGGGGTFIVANRARAATWETFRLWRINETSFHIRVLKKQFLELDSTGKLVATSTNSETSGIFEIIRKPGQLDIVQIKAPNGLFLQIKANNEDLVTADSNGDGLWDDKDPSVFNMTIHRRLQGEYQVTNGYGPLKAPQIMKEHWDTFIQEEDFSFIATSGLNAVRIPVGWWTTKDPPPQPYVGGSLDALDRAFLWAENYNLKVILDLHALPGSQNGDEHSSTRDGFLEWGQSKETIEESVGAIEFFTAKYAAHSSLYAVELMNEPRAPGVTIDKLKQYYDAAYKVVRMNAPSAFVILSNRLSTPDPLELIHFAKGKTQVVIDVHYYNLFDPKFDKMTIQENIDYIQRNRSKQLRTITMADGGPLTFVGEWVAEWQVKNATMEAYRRFSDAQLQVWGKASFGWAYWSLKHDRNAWSMEWMIKNGSIVL